MKFHFLLPAMALALALGLPGAVAANAVQDGYLAAAKAENPAFASFSAVRGAEFYGKVAGSTSCATCHGPDPKAHGRHATTGQDILPLAPVANPARFTDAAKVEKWFKRNCGDVQKRACTATEKGDFIAYLSSLK